MQNLFKILFERSISILIFIFPFTNMCYFFGNKVFLSVGNKALKVFFVQNIIPLTKFYEQNLYFSFAVMIALFICCARGNLKFLSTFSRYNIICAILLDIICNMVGPIYLYLPTGIIEGTLALQISRDTVPDFETAKVDLFNIFFFIFSSEITSTFSKLLLSI